MGEINLWSLGGVGLAGGLLGSMLGLGGGFFFVPLLTLVLNLPIHVAISSSLVAVIANSITASSTYIKARLPNLRLGMFLLTATTIGAIVSAFIAAFLASPILTAIFGIALIGISYSMLRRRQLAQERASLGKTSVGSADSSSTGLGGSLAASCYYRNLNQVVTYNVNRVPHGWGINLLVGYCFQSTRGRWRHLQLTGDELGNEGANKGSYGYQQLYGRYCRISRRLYLLLPWLYLPSHRCPYCGRCIYWSLDRCPASTESKKHNAETDICHCSVHTGCFDAAQSS